MLDQFKFSKHKQYGHLQHRNLRHRCSVWHTAVVAMCSVLVWQHYECIRSLNKQYITRLQISVCYNMPSLLFSVPIRTDTDKSEDITCTMQTSHRLCEIINWIFWYTLDSQQCKVKIYEMYLRTKIDFHYQNKDSSEVREKKKSKMQ